MKWQRQLLNKLSITVQQNLQEAQQNNSYEFLLNLKKGFALFADEMEEEMGMIQLEQAKYKEELNKHKGLIRGYQSSLKEMGQ